METIKSGLGLAAKDTQEGTEPLSGETGKGTTAEPFDKGNAAGHSGAASNELGGEGPGGLEGKGVDLKGKEGDKP
ncbi:50S ribosomal protein L15 [Physcia stellaris]|nr:50S ribosomal protein L15 [Physcia stellaris]